MSRSGDRDAADGILVGIRVRPLGKGRGASTGEVEVDADAGRIKVHQSTEEFRFWSVFEGISNVKLFAAIGEPMLDAIESGFNSTLLAYGQTGAGKTYSMGEISKLSTEHEGIAHRVVRGLFERMEVDSATYRVRIQYVQIYCEHVNDLLAETEAARHKSLPLREDKKRGVFVQGATQRAADSAEDALRILAEAMDHQAFAATQMNMHSSRSHSVCQLFVERVAHRSHAVDQCEGEATAAAGRHMAAAAKATERSGGHAEALAELRERAVAHSASLIEEATLSTRTIKAKLTLIDLAGSEDVGRSGVQGAALLALGNVIHALTHQGKKGSLAHAPYRDSSLTRVLQQSLGGDCKTTLLCCISPADGDATETLSTLRFAARAKLVQNHAKKHASVEVSCDQNAFKEIAEKLHKQLDEQAAVLTAARAEAERATARALQLCFRAPRGRLVQGGGGGDVARYDDSPTKAAAAMADSKALRAEMKVLKADLRAAEAKVLRVEAKALNAEAGRLHGVARAPKEQDGVSPRFTSIVGSRRLWQIFAALGSVILLFFFLQRAPDAMAGAHEHCPDSCTSKTKPACIDYSASLLTRAARELQSQQGGSVSKGGGRLELHRSLEELARIHAAGGSA
jgi:hypothetical protein